MHLLPLFLLTQLGAQPVLGEAGESCRTADDCQAPLGCVAYVCTAPPPPPPVRREGSACGTTRECGADGLLRCVRGVCARPLSPPPAVVSAPQPAPAVEEPAPAHRPAATTAPPAPPPTPVADDAPSTPAEVNPFESTRFILGLSLGVGPMYAARFYDFEPEPFAGVSGQFTATFRLGLQSRWFEAALELSPASTISFGRATAATAYAALSLGALPRLVRGAGFDVYWPLRLKVGGGFICPGIEPLLTASATVIGIGVRTGSLMFELALGAPRLTVGAWNLRAVSFPITASLTAAF